MTIPLEYGISIDTSLGVCVKPNAELYEFSPERIGAILACAQAYIPHLQDIERIEWFLGNSSNMPIRAIAMALKQHPEISTAMLDIDNNPIAIPEEKAIVKKLLASIDEFMSQNIDRGSLKRHPNLFLRKKIIQRDNGKCRYCGNAITDKIYIDHVVPYALGGKTTPDNLVTTCFNCNSRKGAKTPEQAGMQLIPAQ